MLKTSVIVEDLDDLDLLTKTLRQIKDAGFDAVDPALFTNGIMEIIDSPDALRYADTLRHVFMDSGLTAAQCHTALCPSPDCWERVTDITKKTLPFIARMGANQPVIHPICPLTVNDPLLQADHQTIFNLNHRFYSRLMPIAADHGLTILIENLFADGPCRDAVPCYSSHAEELNELMDAFPGLSICLDTGHAAITGQEPADMVYQLGNRIKALHLHGNDRIQDLHLTPFETTDLGWKDFCKALHDIQYRGTINMEVLSAVRRTPHSVRPALYNYLHACAEYFAALADGNDPEEALQ